MSAAGSKAGVGSVFRVGFSTDPQQQFLYVLGSGKVHTLRRGDLELLGSFPAGGTHGIGADSNGNLYTSGSTMPEKYVKAASAGSSGG